MSGREGCATAWPLADFTRESAPVTVLVVLAC